MLPHPPSGTFRGSEARRNIQQGVSAPNRGRFHLRKSEGIVKSFARLTCAMVVVAALLAACGGGEPAPSPTPRPTAVVVPPAGDLPVPDPQELYVANEDGAELRLQGSGVGSLSWGPNGEMLVIETTYPPEVTHLNIIRPDGAVDRLADLDGLGGNPLWSPEGDRVILNLNQRLTSRIVSVNLTDGDVIELDNAGGAYAEPLAWPTPDGVLVSRLVDDTVELALMDPEGQSRRISDVELHGTGYLGGPVLSDDGKRLLAHGTDPDGVCSGSGMGDTVYIVDLDNGEATTVARTATCSIASVAWSPRETAIAYSVFDQPEGSGAHIVNLATGESRRISNDLDGNLRWLDEDTIIADRLVCWQCDGGVEGLMLLRVDGSGEAMLVEGGAHAVSPAGDRIAVADGDGVRLVALDGSPVATVSVPEPGWQYRNLNWAPDGEQFAFVRFHSPNSARTFEVAADGGDLKTVAALERDTTIQGQFLSPDGKRLATTRRGTPEDEKASTLWLSEPDGSNETRVDAESVGAVAWSPDSSQLAFVAYWDAPFGRPDNGLYLVSADGGGLRNMELPVNDKGPFPPAWSPDGTHLAVTDQYLLHLVDVENGEAATVDVLSIGGAGSISWSGDSKMLAAASGAVAAPRDGSSVILVNADGTGFRAVPKTGSPTWGVGLSPDGSQVAYWKASSGSSRSLLYLADSRTGEGVRIATSSPSGPWRIAWSPDGSRFATAMTVPQGTGIFVVDADDLEIRQVTDGGNVVDLWWAGNDRLRFTTEIGGL